MVTDAMSDPYSLESLRVYTPASLDFTLVIMRVVRSSVVSMWNLPLPSDVASDFPPQDHSMFGEGSPENAHAMVKTFPGSMLISSGRASIFGAEPFEVKKKNIEEVCQLKVICISKLYKYFTNVSDH